MTSGRVDNGIIIALSVKIFAYFKSFFQEADGMYSSNGRSNRRIWAAFRRALRSQNSSFRTISK